MLDSSGVATRVGGSVVEVGSLLLFLGTLCGTTAIGTWVVINTVRVGISRMVPGNVYRVGRPAATITPPRPAPGVASTVVDKGRLVNV